MNKYRIAVRRGRVGWWADVTMAAGDREPWLIEDRDDTYQIEPSPIIELQGPFFWRPTERWVLRRAEIHVARKLRDDRRRGATTTRIYTEET